MCNESLRKRTQWLTGQRKAVSRRVLHPNGFIAYIPIELLPSPFSLTGSPPKCIHPSHSIFFCFLLGCKTFKENMNNSYQLLQVAKMQKDEALPQRNEAYYRHGTAASSMRVSIPTAATAGGFRFQAVASRKPTVSTREPTLNPIF